MVREVFPLERAIEKAAELEVHPNILAATQEILQNQAQAQNFPLQVRDAPMTRAH
jgi:hypothetical protein